MRIHNGGFIGADHIFDIGTPDRGRDGDTARDASKKYNDHRHSAAEFSTREEFVGWILEKESPLIIDNNDMGNMSSTNNPIRKKGDLAFFGGILWMYNGTGVTPITANGVAFDSEAGNIVSNLQIQEFPFIMATYENTEVGGDVALEVKKLLGHAVVDFSAVKTTGSEISAKVNVIASVVDNAFGILAQDLGLLPQDYEEGAELSLRCTIVLEKSVMNNARRFIGVPVHVLEIPLNAYASIGDEYLEEDIDDDVNQIVKYSIYLKRPTLAEFLSTSDKQFTDEQKALITDFLNSMEVSLSKCCITISSSLVGV